MTNARKIRSDINKLTSLSVYKPDYYFIHGFVTGVACAPEILPNSVWQKALFGEINFTSEDQMSLLSSLIDFYNQIMTNAMERKLKLPTQCKLSTMDFIGSVAPGEPLPQWCQGMLSCINLFNTEMLDDPQLNTLVFAEQALLTFTSYANLRAACRTFGEYWEASAMNFRRELTTDIDQLLGALRFGEIDEIEQEINDMVADGTLPDLGALTNNDAPPNMDDFMNMFAGGDDNIDYDYEDKVDTALYEDTPEALALLHQLIADFEKEKGPQYFKENEGHFWLIHETRTYMMLRQRLAFTYFNADKRKEAIAELQDLLRLNPNDNQALRHSLASWLVIEKDWESLTQLLAEYDDEISVPLLAAKALMLFAQDPKSTEAKTAKKELLKANKHLVKYLTGQKKAKHPPEFYSPGAASEAETYLFESGKQAWLSVDGALFWLRKK